MTLNPQDIELAYQLFLGRKPSPAETNRMQSNQTTLAGVRRVFLTSQEFQQNGGFGPLPDKAGQTGKARTLIHLHIPKSAGSSLSRLLVKNTRPEQRLTLGNDGLAKLRKPPGQLKKLRFIFGHMSHGVADMLPQRCHYISVLRRPGPRLLSFYRYVGRTDHHPLYNIVTNQKMSFGDFLDYTFAHPAVRFEVDNGQIRRLAGNMRQAGLGRERQLLRLALHNVMAPNFTYGLTEHFKNFQTRLVRQGLLSEATPIRENAAPEPGKLDEALAGLNDGQREIYRGYIAWDSQLYSICRQVYFSGRTAREPLP
ncbi:MAG: sulfotransferase family 2 domain-containing protein [Pseudomonadota bacterium]